MSAPFPDRGYTEGHLPTLRQMRFLTLLAEHGSFSRAAEAAGVTQPTLSAAIKELEDIAGAVLVERAKKGVTLTPAGERAIVQARRALASARDFVLDARAASEPLSGEFRLGVIPTIAPFVLPRLLAAVSHRYPKLDLVLREDLTGRLLDDLRARMLDAALIALPYRLDGFEAETVGADEFLFAAPRAHPLSGRNDLEPAAIKREELLLLDDGHCLREHALALCERQPSNQRLAAGASSLHTLVRMVEAGLGVTILPRLAVDAGVASGADVAVTPFMRPVIGRDIGVVWRSGSSRAPDARLLARLIRDQLDDTIGAP